MDNHRSVRREGKRVFLVDQTKLPHEEAIFCSEDYQTTCQAIKDMVVRGAPAIGAAGAYAYVQAAIGCTNNRQQLKTAATEIRSTRPTAVDLFNILQTLTAITEKNGSISDLEQEAEKAVEGIVSACRRIGEFGATLIPDGARILTHCHTGSLATVEYGTAFAAIRIAHEQGKNIFVYVDETRPRNQGALTSWELSKYGVPHEVIVDNARALLMQKKRIDLAIVGADRICGNGDFANKIGTYDVAVLAKHHGLPFYVAAPLTTFDFSLSDGSQIPIEERPSKEVLEIRGTPIYTSGTGVYNPAFDVTPADLVTAYITEKGIMTTPQIGAL
ncbi:S-methyl-5-thioribose-1-phosphate isomerase [Candidatus Woesearchaeota archaeon]|nr:S-methyl-5-thioribose-1-phosphate isomerase [Candidatus Woesearchaeota archaeon]